MASKRYVYGGVLGGDLRAKFLKSAAPFAAAFGFDASGAGPSFIPFALLLGIGASVLCLLLGFLCAALGLALSFALSILRTLALSRLLLAGICNTSSTTYVSHCDSPVSCAAGLKNARSFLTSAAMPRS